LSVGGMKKGKKPAGVYLWMVLWRAARAVEGVARSHVSSLNMGISDFGVLELLLHKGDTPVNTIGRKILLTSGSITPAVDRLERKGLVERKNHPDDRRVRLVGLTPKGRVVIRSAFGEHRRVMERVAGVLSVKERETLARLLKKLGKSVREL